MEAHKQEGGSWLRFNQTGITLIAVFLLIAMLPSIITNTFGAIVTLSVNSVTESLQLALKAERTYSWRLPPGTFALLSGGGDGCQGGHHVVHTGGRVQLDGHGITAMPRWSGGETYAWVRPLVAMHFEQLHGVR